MENKKEKSKKEPKQLKNQKERGGNVSPGGWVGASMLQFPD